MAVYFFQEQGGERLIKIGKANNVVVRFGQVKKQSEVELKILGYIDGDEREERLLHAVFVDYHSCGEWFRPCDMLVKFIKRNAKPLSIPEVPLPTLTRKTFTHPEGIRLIQEYGVENLIGISSTEWYRAIRPLREQLEVLAPYSRENALLQIKKAFRHISGIDAPSGAG